MNWDTTKQEEGKDFTVNSPFYNSLTSLGLLMLLILFCTLMGMGMIAGLSLMQGTDFQTAFSVLSEENNITNRNNIRLYLCVNHVTMFIFPAIIFGWILFKRELWKFFNIHRFPSNSNIGYGIIFLVGAFPFVQFMYWFNQQLPLPSWAITMEETTQNMLEGLLTAEYSYELIYNLIVIAVIPAIGEELIFRGIVQKKLMAAFKNPVWAIWVAAFIFSAFHMQFEGMIPRMILGALLGYLYYWTGNLWVPILAHFANNAFQIVLQYFYSKELSTVDLNNTDEVSWLLSVFSFIFVIAIGRRIFQSNML